MSNENKSKTMADIKNELIKSNIAKFETIYGKHNNKAFVILNIFCFSNLDPVNDKNEVENSYTDAKGDGKIDAIIINEQEIICIQATTSAKFSEDQDKFEIFLSNVYDLFYNEEPTLLNEANEKIKNQYNKYTEVIKNSIPSISAFFCFNGKLTEDDIKTIDNLKIKYRTIDSIEIKDIDSIYTNLRHKVIKKPQANDILFSFKPYNSQSDQKRGLLEIYKDNIKAYQFFVKARDIVRLVDTFIKNRGSYESLFDLNIRGYLGTGNNQVANKSMVKVLTDTEERKYFGIYNNGITIVSNKIEIEKPLGLKATNPSIINGLQTTMTIYNTIKHLNNIPEEEFNKEDKDLFLNTEVIIRLYAIDGDDLLNPIVMSSNTQAQISLGNKLSNLEFSKKLDNYFSNDKLHNFKYVRKVTDIDNNKETFVSDDALKYWYATYYKKPHKANSRRINVVSYFFNAFNDLSKENELRNMVNRKDDIFLKEVLCACKLYHKLKHFNALDTKAYYYDMIAYIISSKCTIDGVYRNPIEDNDVENGIQLIESIFKENNKNNTTDKRNFIRNDEGFNAVNGKLNPPTPSIEPHQR
jgi:hypothetical protein